MYITRHINPIRNSTKLSTICLLTLTPFCLNFIKSKYKNNILYNIWGVMQHHSRIISFIKVIL